MPATQTDHFEKQFARLSSLRNRSLGMGISDNRPLSPDDAREMERLQAAVDASLNASAPFSDLSQLASLGALSLSRQ